MFSFDEQLSAPPDMLAALRNGVMKSSEKAGIHAHVWDSPVSLAFDAYAKFIVDALCKAMPAPPIDWTPALRIKGLEDAEKLFDRGRS